MRSTYGTSLPMQPPVSGGALSSVNMVLLRLAPTARSFCEIWLDLHGIDRQLLAIYVRRGDSWTYVHEEAHGTEWALGCDQIYMRVGANERHVIPETQSSQSVSFLSIFRILSCN